MKSHYFAFSAALLLAGCASQDTDFPIGGRDRPFFLPSRTPSEPLYVYKADPEPEEEVEWQEIPQEEQRVQSEAERLRTEAEQALQAGDAPAGLSAMNQAAKLNDAQAHYELARIYTEGKLVTRDLDVADHHLNESAALGNPEATRVIGWHKIRGDNGPVDLQGGVALMEQAAEHSVRAQREVGMLFANLYQPHLNDETKGRHYLAMASDAGDAEASYQLGRFLQRKGETLEAVHRLSLAAEQGNEAAASLLREIDPGHGVSTGESRVDAHADAETLYRQANAILLKANNSLESEARAYALFSLAADQGHQLAGAELAALEGVNSIMSKQEPGWLEREKAEILEQP